MSINPLVTIICTCFNHGKFVQKSLNSVINQSYKNIELIIVDNASEDNSVEEIEKWVKNHTCVKFIKNKSNLGITQSFNRAVKYASGSFLMDLSTDDVLLENCVGNLLEEFAINPNTSMVFSNANIIDENDNILHSYFLINEDSTIVDKSILNIDYKRILEGGACICSVSAMFKKDVFEELGGYDENLDFEDLDFWIRLSRVYKIKYLDKILVHKRNVSNSLLSYFFIKSSMDLNKSSLIILNKAYYLNQNKAEHKALLKRVHNFIIVNFRIRNYLYVMRAFMLKLKIFIKINFGE